MFITFEGGEGVGKTTVLKAVKKYLDQNKIDAILTREPGGTKNSEKIRNKLLNNPNLTNKERLNLFVEARIDHNNEIIIPALNENKLVFCDRYFDSTFVYQGLILNEEEFIYCVKKNLNEKIRIPDYTFIFDLEPKIAHMRISENNRETNFLDNLSLKHHEKIRKGFLTLQEKKMKYFPKEFKNQKVIIIDATQSLEKMVEFIIKTLKIRSI